MFRHFSLFIICYILLLISFFFFFFFQAEDGIRDLTVTGVQTCALPIYLPIDADHESDDLRLAEVLAADVDRLVGIGRAAGRGRGEISVGAGSFKKKKKKKI